MATGLILDPSQLTGIDRSPGRNHLLRGSSSERTTPGRKSADGRSQTGWEIAGFAVIRNGIQRCRCNTLRRHAVELTSSLITAEEKQLVLLDGSAECASVLVLSQNLLPGSTYRIIAIVKEVVGIESFIPEEFKQASVELVAAAL